MMKNLFFTAFLMTLLISSSVYATSPPFLIAKSIVDAPDLPHCLVIRDVVSDPLRVVDDDYVIGSNEQMFSVIENHELITFKQYDMISVHVINRCGVPVQVMSVTGELPFTYEQAYDTMTDIMSVNTDEREAFSLLIPPFEEVEAEELHSHTLDHEGHKTLGQTLSLYREEQEIYQNPTVQLSWTLIGESERLTEENVRSAEFSVTTTLSIESFPCAEIGLFTPNGCYMSPQPPPAVWCALVITIFGLIRRQHLNKV